MQCILTINVATIQNFAKNFVHFSPLLSPYSRLTSASSKGKNRKRAQKLEQVQEKKQTANLDEAVARALDILPKDDPNELANLSAPEREELFVGHVQSGENAAKIGLFPFLSLIQPPKGNRSD